MTKKQYPWDSIRGEYEIGKTNAYLQRKYDIPASTLSTQIKRKNWMRNANNEMQALKAFENGCEQISKVKSEVSETKAKAINNEMDLILERTNINNSNIKLIKASQSVIANAFNKKEVNLSNVGQATRAVRDIDTVVNPNKTQPIPTLQVNITTLEQAKINAKELGIPDDVLKRFN